MYGSIIALDESSLVEGLLYAGTDDGLIQVTEDGGKNWRKIDKIYGVPEFAFVNDVKADLHDADTVYVALDNHKYGDFNPYLLKSTDRGRTWRSIAGDPAGSGLPARHLVWRLVQDHVKKDLLERLLEFFGPMREKRAELEKRPDDVEDILASGAGRARQLGAPVMAAAREAGCFVCIGLNERDGGTLYNTLLFIDAEGRIAGKHRKLVPTASERLIWGQGDGSTLPVVETAAGRVGAMDVGAVTEGGVDRLDRPETGPELLLEVRVRGDHLLGESVGDVLVCRLGPDVAEREDRDRLPLDRAELRHG